MSGAKPSLYEHRQLNFDRGAKDILMEEEKSSVNGAGSPGWDE